MIASSLNYSQTINDNEAKWKETVRILAQEFSNPALGLLKSLSTEQLFAHRERLLKQFQELGLTHGYEMLYNRHV
ncbi:MAG: hypothetical protein GWN00_32075, partial [Aliifodinibius sp.]|nr:hypothetical protein [Fodinibius sp.]NIY29257.1 hypothetical protein [Fodinibius sp.]